MWPIDKQTLIQIIILLFFAGAAIVQVLFRALAKSAQRPRAPGEGPPGGRPGEKPFKDVRDFLKEIRAEADRAAGGRKGEERKVPVPGQGQGQGQVLVWEVVEEPKAPPRPALAPAAPAPARGERPGPRGRPAEGPPRGRPSPRMEDLPKSVHQYLEELARRDREAAEREATEREAEEDEAGAGESPAEIEEPARGRKTGARGPAAPRARSRARRQKLPGGLTLRDAVIAQVILGPPRCGGPRRLRR